MDAKKQNELRKKNGARGWSDNSTFCLFGVTDQIADNKEERRQITLHLKPSWYRYNVIAKQEAGADERWRALQKATMPLKPVPHLASGIGICVNVICDGGKSIIIGERSNDETFRKGEFDVAVVEGIRPSSDLFNGSIDLTAVVYRALEEELGLEKNENGRPTSDLVDRLVIYEFGCDLEFYQWNFLCFAEVALTFDEIYSCWQKAKDRKENHTIHSLPNEKLAVREFVEQNAIWSAGAACALRTFDFL